MTDDLLHYYERELGYLRRAGAEFAGKYPNVASRLGIEATKCDDPHVERLLEGFSFLAARVHRKLDEDFPEISEALLSVIYPQYVRPIPSMALVEFHLDPEQGKLTDGLKVPRETVLYTKPVRGTPCRFKTCYDTTLWPLHVAEAEWCAPHELKPPVRARDAVGALRIRFECPPGVKLHELEMDRLRLHISAEATAAYTLYEILCNSVQSILLRGSGSDERQADVTGELSLHPVGFGEDEGMLPYPKSAFLPYRMIQEYFVFPEKYLFLDLCGLNVLADTEWESGFEVIVLIAPFGQGDRSEVLETGVSRRTFRLGCTPVVNLFQRSSEPILVSHKRQEYPIVADARRRDSTRIYSVDNVTGVGLERGRAMRFQPLYSLRHGFAEEDEVYWYARRRHLPWGPQDGTHVAISFVDREARMIRPDLDAVTAKLTCHNGDLPSQLPFGADEGDFEMQGGGPIAKVVAVVKPTETIEPALGKPLLWRLISQLSLNYVSLVDGGPEALQELLRLHNAGDRSAGEKQVQGIVDMGVGPHYARIEGEHGLTFARGNRVEVTLDEDHFAGASAYLFASVLERFLGMSVSLNSFCVLVARTKQRKEMLRAWPPRSGRKVLL